ncbi:hypothetical protein Ctob_016509, partial [Chrysochromulina tobinii]
MQIRNAQHAWLRMTAPTTNYATAAEVFWDGNSACAASSAPNPLDTWSAQLQLLLLPTASSYFEPFLTDVDFVLMKFDLSALSAMAPISRALFRYTVYDGGDQAEMHEFCRGWTASNVTYDNLPMPTPPWPFSAAVIDTYWGPTVNDLAGNVATHTVDVTPSINRWLTGTPNHGWIFVPYFGNGCGIRTAAWANVAQQPVLE